MSFALSPCSPMAIPETRSISSPTSPVERRATIVRGQDAFQAGIRHLDRGHRLVDQLADARLLGVGLKVPPARLLRHPEHVLGQIPLVGVLAGCGIPRRSAKCSSFKLRTACRTSPRSDQGHKINKVLYLRSP